jgi:UDP-N-acetylglucosamine acyltransferase
MNNISKLTKICKSLTIGKNNLIGDNVKIMENVIIGNNNKIYDHTIIYPNTIIGNNNIFLNNNKIGELGVQSNIDYETFEFKYNGLEIGNNNFFHVNNIIFNGYENKTIIGNNNKILAENHVGHDTQIYNNVILYPRCITGGSSKILSRATMGMNSTIQQRKVLGSYSMIGAGNNVSHNVFPFFIFFNNQYIRYNTHIIPKDFEIHKINLKEIINYIKINSFDEHIINEIKNLPENIKGPILDFYINLETNSYSKQRTI